MIQDTVQTGPLPALIVKNIDMFVCPICASSLHAEGGNMQCIACKRFFPCSEGIPRLFWLNEWDGSTTDVTDAMKSFYEETPFPNYEDIDSSMSLKEKAEKGVFARLLNSQMPPNAKVLEAGCGTGQLSNFLGMTWGRTVFGADMCLNSLKLGHRFKEQNQIENVAFLQMNLFRPVFRPESFDLVVCNGVLHHTSNPFLGFQSIGRLVKKGGYIVIGLYNTFGRISTDLRRFIFNLSGNRFKFLDSRLRDKNVSGLRRHTWFMDQYKNPHESKHTIGEVLHWFEECGFEFCNSIPKATIGEPFAQNEQLFAPHPSGTQLDHFLIQFSLCISGGKEGGFFVMIGQKK